MASKLCLYKMLIPLTEQRLLQHIQLPIPQNIFKVPIPPRAR